jgi:ectoine hydroxylase-related dioxygenase (phytanoyl-CoA dioxygenase family)
MSHSSSSAEREQFLHQGFLVVRQLFNDAEVAELVREADRVVKCDDLIDTDNLRCRWQSDCLTGECLFDAFDPIMDLSDGIAELAGHEALLSTLAGLLDDDACLFKDKLIFKPPGAGGYGLHQDYIAWPDFPRSFITAAIAIDSSDPANGCIEVFPGGHTRGCLSPEDGMYHELPVDSVDSIQPVSLYLQPGDAAFFGCFMPHRSAANQSDRWRRQLYLSYNARRDGGEQREQHYAQFHAWLKDRYADHGRQQVYFK